MIRILILNPWRASSSVMPQRVWKPGTNMMNQMRLGIALSLLLALVWGCAAPRANLIARTNGATIATQNSKWGLMPRVQPTDQQRALDDLLTAALGRQGLKLVAAPDSDFTILINQEFNYDRLPETVYSPGPDSTHRAPGAGAAQEPFQAPSSRVDPALHPLEQGYPTRIEHRLRTAGLRIHVYDTRECRQGRFRTLWDGYIEAGLELKPEQQPALVDRLTGYLGQDFIGHVDVSPTR